MIITERLNKKNVIFINTVNKGISMASDNPAKEYRLHESQDST